MEFEGSEVHIHTGRPGVMSRFGSIDFSLLFSFISFFLWAITSSSG